MSIANTQLAVVVKRAVEDWTPERDYDHESKFENDLREYLHRRLNARGGFEPGEKIVVEREHGNVGGDVVVNDSIGIGVIRDFSTGQITTLREQLDAYRSEYDYVISLACGIEDGDGWRRLQNEYEHGSADRDPPSPPVRFIHKPKSTYGTGATSSDYDDTGGERENRVNPNGERTADGHRSPIGGGRVTAGGVWTAIARLAVVLALVLVILGTVAAVVL